MMQQQTEPTVSLYLSPEGNGKHIDGAINGVNFRIRTGRLVEVPERIANVLRDSQKNLLFGAEAVKAYAAAGGKRL